MPSSLTDDIQQIWWLYGWSDDRSFGWSVGWWVSCPENGNDSEPIIGHLSGISDEPRRLFELKNANIWRGVAVSVVPGSSNSGPRKLKRTEKSWKYKVKVGPTALKLNTSIHCQTKCGRCLSNVSFRNAPGGAPSEWESMFGALLWVGVTYILYTAVEISNLSCYYNTSLLSLRSCNAEKAQLNLF